MAHRVTFHHNPTISRVHPYIEVGHTVIHPWRMVVLDDTVTHVLVGTDRLYRATATMAFHPRAQIDVSQHWQGHLDYLLFQAPGSVVRFVRLLTRAFILPEAASVGAEVTDNYDEAEYQADLAKAQADAQEQA